MRKRQISPTPPSVRLSDEAWIDVEHVALVEVTSEENGYPIESRWRRGSRGPCAGPSSTGRPSAAPCPAARRLFLALEGQVGAEHDDDVDDRPGQQVRGAAADRQALAQAGGASRG